MTHSKLSLLLIHWEYNDKKASSFYSLTYYNEHFFLMDHFLQLIFLQLINLLLNILTSCWVFSSFSCYMFMWNIFHQKVSDLYINIKFSQKMTNFSKNNHNKYITSQKDHIYDDTSWWEIFYISFNVVW